MFRPLLIVACVIAVSSADLVAQEKRAVVANASGVIETTPVAEKYGPHARNVMDVWLARSDRPTPVLVSIHGGAF